MAASLRLLFIAMVSAFVLTGCEMIGGIFKAGVWTGVIIVAVVLIPSRWAIGQNISSVS